jgi:thiosulfate reductase / polysulfide reductase chain A
LPSCVRSGATLIVADPRFSVAASKAKHWLPVKAGTDIALLLAWMNVIVRENLYDKKFVAKHGSGFAQFRQAIAGSTPEWAAGETGCHGRSSFAQPRAKWRAPSQPR